MLFTSSISLKESRGRNTGGEKTDKIVTKLTGYPVEGRPRTPMVKSFIIGQLRENPNGPPGRGIVSIIQRTCLPNPHARLIRTVIQAQSATAPLPVRLSTTISPFACFSQVQHLLSMLMGDIYTHSVDQ